MKAREGVRARTRSVKEAKVVDKNAWKYIVATIALGLAIVIPLVLSKLGIISLD